jgi:hypothetical protein
MRAAEALGERRFVARLEARVAACDAEVTSHERERVQPARRAEDLARAAFTRARARREVVERAIERRAAARRREVERRAEAAADDRPHRAKR